MKPFRIGALLASGMAMMGAAMLTGGARHRPQYHPTPLMCFRVNRQLRRRSLMTWRSRPTASFSGWDIKTALIRMAWAARAAWSSMTSRRARFCRISTIPGHVDGLKINPVNGDVWATENKDGNPTLAVIDPKSGAFKIYKFDPMLITGGFDDLVFVPKPQTGSGQEDEASPKEDVYIVTSSQADTTTPVIVRISGPLRTNNTKVEAVLPGAPYAVWNVVTNQAEATDTVGDPDSMTLDPAGELVLDNRSDDSLYIVRNPKAAISLLRVPLTLSGAALEVNDTIFTTSETTHVSSTAGTIFVTDTSTNAVYMLTKPYFPSNEIYTAANVANVIGLVDLNTGVVTPIATGFKGLHGLAFSPTRVTLASERDR